jgi:hypothetical protein
MDELGATFGRVSEYLRRQRMNAAAATVSRFEDGHLLASARKLSSGHQTGSPRADDQDMGDQDLGWTSRSHRSPGSLTGVATPWPA